MASRRGPRRTIEGFPIGRDPWAPGISDAESERRSQMGPNPTKTPFRQALKRRTTASSRARLRARWGRPTANVRLPNEGPAKRYPARQRLQDYLELAQSRDKSAQSRGAVDDRAYFKQRRRRAAGG